MVDAEGVVVCGHTRLTAAMKLGLARVSVSVDRHLSPERPRTYRIADNQTATIAEWSFETLPIDLKELRVDGFDFGLLGYNADTLEKVLAPIETVGLVDPNDVLKAAGADCGTIEAIQTDIAVCLRGRGRKSAAIRQLLNRTG